MSQFKYGQRVRLKVTSGRYPGIAGNFGYADPGCPGGALVSLDFQPDDFFSRVPLGDLEPDDSACAELSREGFEAFKQTVRF